MHLVYILLFGLCFFTVCFKAAKLYTIGIRQRRVCSYPFTKGMKAFLLIAGIALFVAWLPDIITSIIRGTSLELLEVYTTEITYVLDMGIISPLIFITYYLAKWEEAYGEKATLKAETMHEKIQRYKEKADKQNASQPYRNRDKGAR